MKNFLFILGFILISLTSCNYDRNENVIYKGPSWEIMKINDSTLLCIPWASSDNSKPYILNLHLQHNDELTNELTNETMNETPNEYNNEYNIEGN